MNDDPLRLLASSRPASPPAALREAALARALASWPDRPPRKHWIDRLWTSRRLRLAWGAAMLLLAATDLLLTPGALPRVSRAGATFGEAWAAYAPAGRPAAAPTAARGIGS